MIDRQIASEIRSLRSLQTIVETYEEIAAMRMRKVKSFVLKNRDFLSQLNEIFKDVEHAYKSQKALFRKSPKKIVNKHRYEFDKTVSILLSANTGLYGDVIRRTINLFIENVEKDDSDMIIVGRVGKNAVEVRNMGKEYTYYDFSDEGVDEENLRRILLQVVKYRTIVVYHGIFQDILTQVPTKSDITKEALTSPSQKSVTTQPGDVRKLFIFEPTLEDILYFFETEIVANIFEQYMYESSLSKFSSRMINLDFAIVNIHTQLKKAQFTRQKIRHRRINMKQQDSISGMSLWGI